MEPEIETGLGGRKSLGALVHRKVAALEAVDGLYKGAVGRQMKLQNPMLEHSSEYVINMWKIYNHVVVGRKNQAQLFNLVAYGVYIFFVLWVLGHLPVPAVMLQHQEAVTDLLLGEEFDSEVTHIYKSYYDVMTVEEMWQWAQGPMAAAVMVDGAPDGKMDALVGTNWLLGPLRIRLERSRQYTGREGCNKTLHDTFGQTMGDKLMDRGIQCTSDFRTDNPSTWAAEPFLDLSLPLSTLGTCSDACAAEPATASREDCESHGCLYTPQNGANAATCRAPEESPECSGWDGDLDACEASPTCTFSQRSFIDAFPQWVDAQRTGKCFKGDCSREFCCSIAGCFDSPEQQQESIAKAGEDDEHACSIHASLANLTWNPQESYRSTVKSDTTTSDNLWAKRRNFGDGGYHIDLPGDSATLVPMLKALEELGFADQFARSIDFQFVLINPNNFTLSDETLFFSTVDSDFNPVVVVSVELNFRFSPSGFLSAYDRIQAVQLKPFHFVFGATTDDDDDNSMIFYMLFLVPVFMIVQELQELSDTGIARYMKSGWNLFEVVYIGTVLLAINSISKYKEMNKFIGMAAFITLFKFLKYVKIFRSTNVLWSTIDRAKAQLFTYLMVMLIIMGSFALLCVMMWGYTSKTFHNIPTAVFSLVRLSSGESELDYQELKRGDASFTPIVFMGFVVFVAIIGMNLMIAIITDYYEEARDAQVAWTQDKSWIQDAFSSKDEYEDYYRGKGLWNEPVTESLTGVVGQAWNAMRGRWIVKPIPKGCGPKTWDKSAKTIAEKVQPKFDTQKYPFTLQRSSIVHVRYRVESHEHSANATNTAVDPKAYVLSSFDDRRGWKPLRSRDPTPVYPNSPESFDDERTRTQVSPLPQPLAMWMSASKLSQYKGIHYLELLKDPSVLVPDGLDKNARKTRKSISALSVEEVKRLLKQLGISTASTTQQALQDMWQQCDINDDQELSREELAKALPGLLNARLTASEFEMLMKQMDTNNDKTISKEEFFAGLEKQDPHVFELVQLHRIELQDRLREALAERQASVDADEKRDQPAVEQLKSLDVVPGDTIKLGTPSEGGIAGQMTLEFQKFLPVRRATKPDKLQVTREIHQAKAEYHQALLDSHRSGRCKKHAEQLIRQYGDTVDPEELPKFLRGHCERCAQAAESDLQVAECEETLQQLHEARAQLEGMERIMVFRVKSVDAWQKFRPMDVNSADDAAGHIGLKLKAACMKDGLLDESISLDQLLDVLVETVAQLMKHFWRHGSTVCDELSAMAEEARVEQATDYMIAPVLTSGDVDVETKRRIQTAVQAANEDDKMAEGVATASQSDSAEIVEQEGASVLYPAYHLTRAVLEAQGRIPELNEEEWLNSPAKDGAGGQTNRALIKEQCKKTIEEMAKEEQKQNQAKHDTIERLRQTYSQPDEPKSPKQAAVGFLDCSSGPGTRPRGSRVQVTACAVEETLVKLTSGEHKCALRELVPNYESGYPRLSAVMNRVLQTVQRVQALNEHTPLLEVSEETAFEMKLPWSVQLKLLFRAVKHSVISVTSSIWKKFQTSNICSKIFFFRHILKAPLRFIVRHLYFHRKIEEDIEDFLHDKCIHVRTSMDSDVAGSLKLQMDTFMSEQNSIRLNDFIYQLEFYTFKTQRPPITAKWHEIRQPSHVVPFVRLILHRNLAKISCLKEFFATLQIPIQDHYTHDDEKRGIAYLLHKYSDFIDRRRGSVPGSPYTSSGVLLDRTLMAVLNQERDDVSMTRAEEEEEKLEEIQRIFKQEVQVFVRSGGADKSAEHVAQAQRTAEAVKVYENQTKTLRHQVQNLVTQLAASKDEMKKSREEAAVEAAAALAASQDELKRMRETLIEAEQEAAANAAALAACQRELRQASRPNEAETTSETAAAETTSAEKGSAGGSADESESNSASETEDLVPDSAP